MRLSKDEINIIKKIIFSYFYIDINECQLFLFGSRVDDKKKGGDIDLLLLLNNSLDYKNILLNKHIILADLKSAIGDQKIDLVITNQEDLKKDIFLSNIKNNSIAL